MDPRRKLQVGDILIVQDRLAWAERYQIPIGNKVLVETLTATKATLNYFGTQFVVSRADLGHDLKWGRVTKLLSKDT